MAGFGRLLATKEAQLRSAGEVLDIAASDLEALRSQAVAAAQAAQRAQTAAQQESGTAELLRSLGLREGVSSSVEADVLRVCEAALAKRRMGLLLGHDAFLLVNRARGTALLSPGEIAAALQSAAKQGRLRLRSLDGVLAVQLAVPAGADDALLEALAEPRSAPSLAAELGLTTSEVHLLLRDAERRGLLVRDEAPHGCFFQRSFF